MPMNRCEDQYVAVVIPYRNSFAEFLENCQGSLREAWEAQYLGENKEENHWDREEHDRVEEIKDLIEELQQFKAQRRKEEGTGKGKDVPPPPRSRSFYADVYLGDVGFFPDEERGKPSIKTKRMLSQLMMAEIHQEIQVGDSNGKIERVIQQKWKNLKDQPSDDLIKRCVRLWKIQQKKPMENYSRVSITEWWQLVKFAKSTVKNALLVVVVPTVAQRWMLDDHKKYLMKPGSSHGDWRDKERIKLKQQVDSIIYHADKSAGDSKEKFSKLITKIFKETNTDEQILKCFNDLLRLSKLPIS